LAKRSDHFALMPLFGVSRNVSATLCEPINGTGRSTALPKSPHRQRTKPMRIRGPGLTAIIAAAIVVFAPVLALAASPAEMFGKSKEGSTVTVDHGAWSKLLSTYVVAGPDGINRVRYADFKREGQPALKDYIKSLEAVDPLSLGRAEQWAFWANLYNAKTIDIVLTAYPVKSIKDISLGGGLLAAVTGGPWKAKVLKVAGQELSLDDIEHGILRPVFKDPRVHFSVNCASIGCPNLMTEAFTGAKLDAQLDAGAKAYVNNSRGINVNGGKVTASSIYDWFKADFGGNAAGVLAHARSHADPALKQKLESITTIAGYDYNWSLNDAAR
jgi:Protein of unknown function, DUF547